MTRDILATSRYRHRSGLRSSASRKWPKRVLIGVSILVVLFVLAGVGGWFYVNSVLGSIKRFDAPTLTAETAGEPIDILLVGSDSREFVTEPGEVAAFGSSATQSGQRADVIVVLRLVPKTHQVEMLSIPRDTYVRIPGSGGSNRVNAAFNTGPSLLVKTIQQDFGIPINHVVVANFPGFEGMVNSLGGISLNFPDPVRDPYSGLDVSTTGCQTVNGKTALALVRSRHLYYWKDGAWSYDGMSDWSRIQRQQAFFHALVNKLNGEFPNLLALNSFMQATSHDVEVDSGFSARNMISLTMQFRGVSSSNLATEVLPTYSTEIAGNDVLIAAEPYARQMISGFLSIGSTPHPTEARSSRTTIADPSLEQSTPKGQVVFDNPKDLPEPWNPKPC